MSWWHYALIALGLIWVLQIYGTWIQMNHYRQVMTGITASFKDGYLGTGNAKSTFGKGLIVILIASADGVVRKALAMEGRSVFARFQEIPEFSGLTLDAIGKEGFFEPAQKARAQAFGKAIEQIRQLQSNRSSEAASGAGKKGSAVKKGSRTKK
ncbi:MAG: transcriptional regulator GutM [Aestuariivirgaceae bacterium]|nr:transcriptional regulator GutM [Aestuariivirgaceae bacterium]